MARARNIKPGFFKNEVLAECSPWARLVFVGLWTLADREGRLEDRPKRIKGDLFPYDAIEVDPLLQDLAKRGFIARYAVDGVALIQIVNFTKHQTPHHREADSTLPPMPSPGHGQGAAQGEPMACRGQHPGEHKTCPGNGPTLVGTSPSDSLIPDSLIPDSLIAAPAAQPSTPDDDPLGQYPEDFLRFWAECPRKVGKGAALKAWAKLKPSASAASRITAAMVAQCASPDWLREGGRYVPHPSTWLNEWRFDDPFGGTDEERHHGSNCGRTDDRPDWLAATGFENVWEAENAGCRQDNAAEYRDGRKVAA